MWCWEQPNFTTFVEPDLTQQKTNASASNLLNPVSVTSDGVRLFVTDLRLQPRADLELHSHRERRSCRRGARPAEFDQCGSEQRLFEPIPPTPGR